MWLPAILLLTRLLLLLMLLLLMRLLLLLLLMTLRMGWLLTFGEQSYRRCRGRCHDLHKECGALVKQSQVGVRHQASRNKRLLITDLRPLECRSSAARGNAGPICLEGLLRSWRRVSGPSTIGNWLAQTCCWLCICRFL